MDFPASLLLRSFLDFAGRNNQFHPDVTCRAAITHAFRKNDLAGYFTEVRKFFAYCIEDVIFNRLLQEADKVSTLLMQGSYFSRVDAALPLEAPSACQFEVNRAGLCTPQLEEDLLKLPFSFHRLIDQALPQKCGFSLKFPLNAKARLNIRALLKDIQSSSAACSLGHESPLFPLLTTGNSAPLVQKILDMADHAGCTDPKTLQSLETFSEKVLDQWFGFTARPLPVFGFGCQCHPRLRHLLQPNREWLKTSELSSYSLIELLLSLLADPKARALHFFHFSLGYENDVVPETENIFAVHGDLTIFDYGKKTLSNDNWKSIHLLMQEAMSSMAILENALVQGALEAEISRVEATRKILRKMHHSLGGPISAAFNTFALIQPQLLQNCRLPDDRKALGEIYATLRSAKSQTVSWTAFSSPERLIENRVQSVFDLREWVQATLAILQLLYDRPWGILEGQSSWKIAAFLDLGLIEVALWQMLKNAFDHLKVSPPETHGSVPLMISGTQSGGFFSLKVSNTGLQCAPSLVSALQKAIKDRLDAPSSKADGQGLGLATCAEIALVHGGEFSLSYHQQRFETQLKLPIKD